MYEYLGDVLLERDGQSDCKLAFTRLEFGYTILFNRSSLVVMFVLLSIIEALPGGICSLVILKY